MDLRLCGGIVFNGVHVEVYGFRGWGSSIGLTPILIQVPNGAIHACMANLQTTK